MVGWGVGPPNTYPFNRFYLFQYTLFSIFMEIGPTGQDISSQVNLSDRSWPYGGPKGRPNILAVFCQKPGQAACMVWFWGIFMESFGNLDILYGHYCWLWFGWNPAWPVWFWVIFVKFNRQQAKHTLITRCCFSYERCLKIPKCMYQ